MVKEWEGVMGGSRFESQYGKKIFTYKQVYAGADGKWFCLDGDGFPSTPNLLSSRWRGKAESYR